MLLRATLDRLKAETQIELVDQPGVQSVQGGFNRASFKEARMGRGYGSRFVESQNLNTLLSEEKKMTPQAKTLKEKAERGILRANAVQRLLVERGVNTRYLSKSIYFDKQGKRLSLQASEGSLEHYLNKRKTISLNDAYIIFSQICLGVAALHEKDLVHRDLKRGNILVNVVNGKLIVTVHDFDSVIPVNAQGQFEKETYEWQEDGRKAEITFTWDLGVARSPELQSIKNAETKKIVNTTENHQKYKKFNLKAADCYDLGYLLKRLIEKVDPSEDLVSINQLYLLLIQPELNGRWTVEQVLNNYFQQDYLDWLQTEYVPHDASHEFIGKNKNYARSTEVGNSYLSIDDQFQTLYRLGDNFYRQTNCFLDETGDPEKLDVFAFENINKTLVLLNREIGIVRISGLTPTLSNIVNTLETEITSTMAAIQQLYARLMRISIQPILQSQVEVKVEPTALPANLTKNFLITIVQLAAFEFGRVNFSANKTSSRFFSKNGKIKDSAATDELISSLRQKSIQEIVTTLNGLDGFGPASFKSILNVKMKENAEYTIQEMHEILFPSPVHQPNTKSQARRV